MLFLDNGDTTAAYSSLTTDCTELLRSMPAAFTDSVTSSLRGSCVVSMIVGRRRFGFSGEKRTAVKDEVKSFINGSLED